MQNLILISLTQDDLKRIVLEALREQAQNEFIAPIVDNTEELMSINEAVRLLKVSKPTLWAYTKEGLLQKHRLGSKVYYKRGELLNAIQQVQLLKHKKRG